MENHYGNTYIQCPHCNHIETASWEFERDEGEWDCGNCEKSFNVKREVQYTYNSEVIECQEKKEEHTYTVSFKYIQKVLPEESIYKVYYECTKCLHSYSEVITKEQYEQLTIEELK